MMPRYLKLVYIGGAALAVVAFVLGSYDYLTAGADEASLGADILLPLAVLAIIMALYHRRKREMERSDRSS